MVDATERLIQQIKTDEIKFVRFEASNIAGMAIGMIVPVRSAAKFLRKGFPFVTISLMCTSNGDMPLDECAKSGFRNIAMFADPSSYRIIPWKTCTKTASVMIMQPPKYNHLYPQDVRSIAIKQCNLLNKMNLNILSATEHEFYLLDAATNKPISKSGCYNMQRISIHQDFFAKVDDNLHKMGIDCDRLHSEVASGQYEITALPSYNIRGADNAFWIRNGVREMAQLYKNWNATFLTHLPSLSDGFDVTEDDSGSHFNHSLYLRDGDKSNALFDVNKNDLSLLGLYWIGGILSHIGAITALCCPTTICYETRFSSPWVSSYGNWGKFNRTALIRVKPSKNNTHYEFRLPSSLSNTYLVLASVICAGLLGIRNKILPPKEIPVDLIDQNEREKSIYYTQKLPVSLADALNQLENDKEFSKNFDDNFVKYYITTKRMEINEMKNYKQNKQKPLLYSLL